MSHAEHLDTIKSALRADALRSMTIGQLPDHPLPPRLQAFASIGTFHHLPPGFPRLPPGIEEGALFVSATAGTFLRLCLIARRTGGQVIALSGLLHPSLVETPTQARSWILNRALEGLRTPVCPVMAVNKAIPSPRSATAVAVTALMLSTLGFDRSRAHEALSLVSGEANRLPTLHSPSLALSLIDSHSIPGTVPAAVADAFADASYWIAQAKAGGLWIDAADLVPAPAHEAWRAGLAEGSNRNPFLRLAAGAVGALVAEPITLQVLLPPDLGNRIVVRVSPDAPWGTFESVAPAVVRELSAGRADAAPSGTAVPQRGSARP